MAQKNVDFSEIESIIADSLSIVSCGIVETQTIYVLPSIFIHISRKIADVISKKRRTAPDVDIVYNGTFDQLMVGYLSRCFYDDIKINYHDWPTSNYPKIDYVINPDPSLIIKKSLDKNIADSFDIKQLTHYCKLPTEAFFSMGEVTITPQGKYTFFDRGSNILAIAHLDTAQDNKSFLSYKDMFTGETVIKSTSLDDRLGVYTILDLLPALGINCDVLLTEGEEIGQSTAMHFLTSKNYNWMFQFDRAGTGVVLYQYETAEMNSILEAHDFIVENGSFSDICFLEHLGIKGFNFGSGYYRNHRPESYMILEHFFYSIKRFISFYNEHKGTYFPHGFEIYEGSYDNDGFLYCDCCDWEVGSLAELHELTPDVLVCEYCYKLIKGAGLI